VSFQTTIQKILNKPHLSILVLVLFLTLGLLGRELVIAAPWTGPTADPPAGNVAPPINASIIDQFKQGGLLLGGDQMPLEPNTSLEIRGEILASSTVITEPPNADNQVPNLEYMKTYHAANPSPSTSGTGGGGAILEWIEQPVASNSYRARVRWGPTLTGGFGFDCFFRVDGGVWIFQGDCYEVGIDLSSYIGQNVTIIGASQSAEIHGYINNAWEKLGEYGWSSDATYDTEGNKYTYDGNYVLINDVSATSYWVYAGGNLPNWNAAILGDCTEDSNGTCGVSDCSCAPSCKALAGPSCPYASNPYPQVSENPLHDDYLSASIWCYQYGYTSGGYCSQQGIWGSNRQKWDGSNWNNTNGYACAEARCSSCTPGYWYKQGLTVADDYECTNDGYSRLRVKDGLGYTNTLTAEITGGVACGNGVIEAPEECDDGNLVSGDGCDDSCIDEFCGDGTVNDTSEECDDGNTVSDDGCSATCIDEFCGDGIVNDVSEACDDGGTVDGDGCNAICQDEYCGDSIVNDAGAEECDDGDADDTDGCQNDCDRNIDTCTVDADCVYPEAPFCRNGYCCDTSCDSVCEQCDKTGLEGFCQNRPGNSQPTGCNGAGEYCNWTGVCQVCNYAFEETIIEAQSDCGTGCQVCDASNSGDFTYRGSSGGCRCSNYWLSPGHWNDIIKDRCICVPK